MEERYVNDRHELLVKRRQRLLEQLADTEEEIDSIVNRVVGYVVGVKVDFEKLEGMSKGASALYDYCTNTVSSLESSNEPPKV